MEKILSIGDGNSIQRCIPEYGVFAKKNPGKGEKPGYQ
jgi:hypothetical protein